MKTKAAALYQFYSRFLPAYPAESVPTGEDAPPFPYLTYSLATDSFDTEVSLDVSLWYRSTKWTDINAKTEELSKAIGLGGKILRCDGGAIWLKRGTPFAQSMGDDSDNMIKRKYINLTAEFITAN